jgi:hypothetical protein
VAEKIRGAKRIPLSGTDTAELELGIEGSGLLTIRTSAGLCEDDPRAGHDLVARQPSSQQITEDTAEFSSVAANEPKQRPRGKRCSLLG